uniref:Caspase recruitment domain-containing protein n=1 Tax=Trichobilharzia regenti TaxID=157069 RepID=A0AA85IXX8_TRIRE|nr:unnamed protein product [Trichobilharzia regenti]
MFNHELTPVREQPGSTGFLFRYCLGLDQHAPIILPWIESRTFRLGGELVHYCASRIESNNLSTLASANSCFIVMLSNEEQAVMRNLPALVADLESMDIIDHLTATTPPSITPADYESIIATSQREGRRAGVRCLVACLLRRTDSSKVFQSFINILKEDYRHLSDLLSSTYESLKGSNEKDESDFGTTASSISLHSDAVVKANDPTGIITPCQLDLDILSMIPY